MYERIVVPLDGSGFGDAALPFAESIARRSGAAVDLVHVHLPAARTPSQASLTPYRYEGVEAAEHPFDVECQEREAAEIEDRARRMLHGAGVPASTRILHGPVPAALAQDARAASADLVVMATHGGVSPTGARMKSVAEQLVRHLDGPFLLLRPDPVRDGRIEPGFSRILVALDGSAFSEQILGPAVEMARLYDARLLLALVVSPAASVGLRVVGLDPAGLQARRDDAEAYLTRLAAQLAARVPEPDVLVRVGRHAAASILECARTEGADLVAMATHGRGGVSRLLLGSTAQEVVRRSDRPLLLYRPVEHQA
ncbi:MAG TPA: universal stress protein [Longimicrobiales bacterium]|nr:universal stress protein [Longimicrobiales bacterium]